MTVFEHQSVSEALERSIRNAKHLRAKHSAMIAAARALARKIDAWDVIVEWALDDAAQVKGKRPAVPSNDNVSIASFLKYLDALGLAPEGEAGVPGRPATLPLATGSAPPSGTTNKVLQFRSKAAASQ